MKTATLSEAEHLQDTLLLVQEAYQRLEQENAHLKAELDYERGWRLKYEELNEKGGRI